MIKTALQRRRAKAIMKLLNLYAWSVLYAEIRPMQTASLTLKALKKLLSLGHTITMDCSEAVTLIFRLAGFKNPNGFPYNGQGYTGDILHLPHFTDPKQLHVATLIVFVATATLPAHVVTVYKANGLDSLVYSHGEHARSAIWSLATERTYHPGQPMVFCEVADL